MKNVSKMIILLAVISNIENTYSNWFSDYFFKKDNTQEQDFESFYFSEIDPLSEDNVEKYKNLKTIEDREKFLNNKLKQLYSLHKNNPKLINNQTLKNIVSKIQQAYQAVTVNSHILFYPTLESFIIYPNYEDTRKQKEIANELENLAKEHNKKCLELYAKAQQECSKLKQHLSDLKRKKFNDLKKSPGSEDPSLHHSSATHSHIHHVHITPKENSPKADQSKQISNRNKENKTEEKESPLDSMTIPSNRTNSNPATSLNSRETVSHNINRKNSSENNSSRSSIYTIPDTVHSDTTLSSQNDDDDTL